MKRKKGLTIALYVAATSLALGEEEIPRPMVEIGPGFTCTNPRKWEGNDISKQAVSCSEVGWGLAFNRTSLRVDTGVALARTGMGLRYRFSNKAEVEFTIRRYEESLNFVYRRKL